MPDDVLILNQPGLSAKTLKSGKVKYSIKITSEPLAINLDPKQIGGEVAVAIALHLRRRMQEISAVAAPATLKARRVAAKAFALGKPWAMKRYAGGKTGAKSPNQSDKKFNDSGRMAQSIVASAAGDSWRVNVAANRLSGDPGTVARIWSKLVELVPEFGSAQAIMEQSDIVRAMVNAKTRMVQKMPATEKPIGIGEVLELFKKGAEILRAAGEVLAA